MSARASKQKATQERQLAREARERQARRARILRNRVLFAVGASVAALAIMFVASQSSGSTATKKYTYSVGSPGVGQQAPPIDLPSTHGGRFDLAGQHGRTVLLYFQEGLTCEPCWTQLKDLDTQIQRLHGLGIDELVSITTDPLSALKTKVSDEGISTPVLSDSSLTVSTAYAANQYGMMGSSRDGHTFIVVGPTGRIRWRADYGGAPQYTMYVPVPTLLAQLRRGLHG